MEGEVTRPIFPNPTHATCSRFPPDILWTADSMVSVLWDSGGTRLER